MTHHIVISQALSAPAREALRDHLSVSYQMHDLLDIEGGTWTLDDARAAATELTAAGYGHTEANGDFQWDIIPHIPAQLPTDNLDELVEAVDLVDRIAHDIMAVRTPENPDPSNPLGISWPILLQLQNVLRIAKYAQSGKLSATDVNTQLPAVATMLARAVRDQVKV